MRLRTKSHPQDEPLVLHGLADGFGLESLMHYEEQQVPPLIMRASIYRYRHCTYFQVHIEGELLKKLKALMKGGAYGDALNLLKERAPGIVTFKTHLQIIGLPNIVTIP